MDDKDFWASVPTLDAPASASAGAAGSGTAPVLQAKLRTQRRTLFKTAGVLGGAFALNVLSWLPQAGSKAARATVGTEHLTCSIFAYDNAITCTGAPYSRNYCGTDGWFLKYTSSVLISGPTVACNGRNAWRWTRSGTPYRCADGYQQVRGGSNTFLICAWSNP